MLNLSMLYSIDSIVGQCLSVCTGFDGKERKGVRAMKVRLQSHLLHL